ncbi:MAG TPA: HepT-like ribonuclease domain-containing protein [Streptosporangiaceae bacterium]|nr:HepT-like ribonuclease domain-containing protein [Streptosporangiaceae bacterium]
MGFRNVLVHDYIRVNDGIVIGRLKALGDLEDFVSQVAAFVAQP